MALRTGGSSNAEEDSVGMGGGGHCAGEKDSAEELHVKEKRGVMERVRKEGRFLERKEVDDCQEGGRRSWRWAEGRTGAS